MRIERISSWLEAATGESSAPLLGDDKPVSNESISVKTESDSGVQQDGLSKSVPIPPLLTKTHSTISYGSIQAYPHIVVVRNSSGDQESDLESSGSSHYSNESLWRQRNRTRLRRQSSKSLLGNSCITEYLGLILILCYCVFTALSGLTVKLLEKDYHAYNICFWRFSSIFVISSTIIVCKKLFSKQSMWPRPLVEEKHEHIKNVLLLMLRGALGCGGRVLYIYSVTCMPLGDSMVIASSSPVFMTVFAYFLLGEKCGIVPVFVAVVTLAGVGVITRPPWLTGGGAYDPNVLLGTGTGFGGMILTTLVMIVMRKLRGIYHAVITISFASWGVVVASILSFQLGVFHQPKQLDHILLLIASGVTSFLGQTFLTLGLKYESAGVVALLTNFAVVFSFTFEYIFLHIAPDVYSICGGIIVILCIVLTTFRKWVGTLPEYHEVRRVFFFLLI